MKRISHHFTEKKGKSSRTGIIGKLLKSNSPSGKDISVITIPFVPFKAILLGFYTIKKASLLLEHLPALQLPYLLKSVQPTT